MQFDSYPEFKILKTLDTPQKIQTFLEDIPFNHEQGGETCMSPLRVLNENRAHCIEGAMVACVALMLQGEKPMIMNLKVKTTDYDHVVAVFKRGIYYGAISKTNHLALRYRDPVYKNTRELAMSYFHEYFLASTGEKTMLGYSKPINMRRFGERWIIRDDDMWDIAEFVFDRPIFPVVQISKKIQYRNATLFERSGAHIQEW